MELVMDYILGAMVAVLETYIIYRYMTVFFDNRYVDKKQTIIIYVVRCVLSFLIGLISVSPIVSMLICIASIFFVTICYMGTIGKKLTVTVITYIFGFIAEAIVAMLVGVSGFDLFGEIVEMGIISNVIIKLIYWLLLLGIQRFKNIGENAPLPKLFIIAIIIIPISYICLEIMIFQQHDVDRILAVISQVCMLCSVFVMLNLYDSISNIFRERTKTAMIEKEKEYYHEQSELLRRKQEELRQFRHDIKNRVVVMQQMIKNNQVVEVLEYTEQITKKLDGTEMYSDTGNLVIDSIINYKLNKAVELGITVESNITIPENIVIGEDDIVVILGNILDNAMEATEKLTGAKYIHINLEYSKSCMFIHIVNNYDSVVYYVGDKISTRKKNQNLHGIGLQSVKGIVDKYNGSLEIEHDEREFRVDILLYI